MTVANRAPDWWIVVGLGLIIFFCFTALIALEAAL
jgi:hypothetical protein